MKKYMIAALCACTAFCGMVANAQSTVKPSPYGKEAVRVPMVAQMANKQGAQSVAITAPEKQLYGEWTILSVNKIDIDTDERAYIYLDFNNGNQVYGCNGCNAINGRFTLKGNNLSFSQMIQGGAECNSITDESEVMHALAEVAKIEEALYEKVPEKDHSLLRDYALASAQLANVSMVEDFITGFRMGAQIMMAVLLPDGQSPEQIGKVSQDK